MYIRFFLFCSFLFISNIHARDYQFNLNVGQDSPDKDSERIDSATLIKFALSNRPNLFRINAQFTYMTGNNFTQGETGLGLYIYPLTFISKAPISPYLYAEGTFGIGSFNEVSRTDGGLGLGAGVDLYFAKTVGVTLAVEQKSATEKASRIWAGIFWR